MERHVGAGAERSLNVLLDIDEIDVAAQGSSDERRNTISAASIWEEEADKRSSPATSAKHSNSEHGTFDNARVELDVEKCPEDTGIEVVPPRTPRQPRSNSPSVSVAHGPDTPTRSGSGNVESRQRLNALLDALQRVAELHMKAVDTRVKAKEKAKLMRNLQAQLLPHMKTLITKVRERLLQAGPEDLTSWEMDFSEAEEFLNRTEEAAEKFDEYQKSTLETEFIMCGLEDELFESYASSESPGSKGKTFEEDLKQLELPKDFLVLDVDKLLTSSDIPEIPGPDPTSPLYRARQPLYRDVTYASDHNIDSASQTADEMPVVDFEIASYPPSEWEQSRRSSDKSAVHDPQDLHLEDTSGEGEQFELVEIDQAMLEAKNELLRTESSRFSHRDLQAFTNWLLHGRPLQERLASGQERLLKVASNLTFLRVWVSHILETMYDGSIGSAPRGHGSDFSGGQTVNQLMSLVNGWMPGPTKSFGQRAASDGSSMSSNTIHKRQSLAVDDRAPDVQPPRSPLPSATMDASAGDSAAPNRPYSRSCDGNVAHDDLLRRPPAVPNSDIPRPGIINSSDIQRISPRPRSWP